MEPASLFDRFSALEHPTKPIIQFALLPESCFLGVVRDDGGADDFVEISHGATARAPSASRPEAARTLRRAGHHRRQGVPAHHRRGDLVSRAPNRTKSARRWLLSTLQINAWQLLHATRAYWGIETASPGVWMCSSIATWEAQNRRRAGRHSCRQPCRAPYLQTDRQ